MTLYCEVCNANHRFTTSEAERIIYSLAASLYCHTMTPIEPEYRKYHAEYCLKGHLDSSYDVEEYGEHTKDLVETRQRIHLMDRKESKSNG